MLTPQIEKRLQEKIKDAAFFCSEFKCAVISTDDVREILLFQQELLEAGRQEALEEKEVTEICPGCRGERSWLAECCNGSGGCPCGGQPYIPCTCDTCGGAGVVPKNTEALGAEEKKEEVRNQSKEEIDKEIKDLEKTLEYEEMQLGICEAHPTNTEQFREGLEKHRQKIDRMRIDLRTKKEFRRRAFENCETVCGGNCKEEPVPEDWREEFRSQFIASDEPQERNAFPFIISPTIHEEILKFIESELKAQALRHEKEKSELKENIHVFIAEECVELPSGDFIPFEAFKKYLNSLS